MDFHVIRPRPPPPPRTPPPPPPKPEPVEKPVEPPPVNPPPAKSPPPPTHHHHHGHRPRSIEYINSRTWRLNLGDQRPNESPHFGDFEYTYYPYHPYGVRGSYRYDPQNMFLPHSSSSSPPSLPFPPPEVGGGALQGPPPLLPLPPASEYQHRNGPLAEYNPSYYRPEYNQGYGRQPPPVTYYYPPPYPAGFFSDENPHGCVIM